MPTLDGKIYLGATQVAGAAGAEASTSAYQRPVDWLTLPAVNIADQKFVGLVAVWDHDSNFLNVKATGAYTIDWGDGTVENIASNTQANHKYTYSTLDASTLTSRGYRQAIVTVTPQSGTWTAFAIGLAPNVTGVPAMAAQWLDMKIAGANLTSLNFGGAAGATAGSMCEQIELVGPMPLVTSAASMFAGNTGLLNPLGVANLTGLTDCTSMFENCRALITLPMFDTKNVTNFAEFCRTCYALTEVPAYNTVKATSFNNAFNSCRQLPTVPLFDTALVTDFNGMFSGCQSLQVVPALNLTKATTATSLSGIFSSCGSLHRSLVVNTKMDISYQGCSLSATALNEVYTNLATASGRTIIVTSNYGTTTDTPSIATAKGWTVTG